MVNYSPEQLQQLYKSLPQNLKEALFSKQNARNIHEICVKNGAADGDKIFDAAKNAGYVLLGLLPPDEFSKVLEKELELESHVAEEIAGEIERFVFYPVKKTLESLYKMEIEPGKEPLSAVSPQKKPKKTKKQDAYREPTE